jgi:hypothetical protein
MFGSTVLEVAVGLALVYLLLSLMCSSINEFFTRMMDWRSKDLEAGIKSLLGDLRTNQGDVSALFYTNPLIRGLIQGGVLKPTYIPSVTFRQALLDIVAPPSGANPRDLPAIRQGVAALPDSQMKTTLLGLIDAAAADLEKAHKHLEQWFDNAMEAVSARYQRWANTLLFGVVILVCVVMNADSLRLSTDLWKNPALRDSLVAGAEQVAKQSPQGGDGAVQAKKTVAEIRGEIDKLIIPVGWTLAEWNEFENGDWPTKMKKIVGILFSAVAVSLGATFWFDLLNKLVNLRAAAAKPPRSDEKKPT